MHASFGRGLFVAGRVAEGQHIGWYDGEHITLQEYCALTAQTGLWHTLKAPGGPFCKRHDIEYRRTVREHRARGQAE